MNHCCLHRIPQPDGISPGFGAFLRDFGRGLGAWAKPATLRPRHTMVDLAEKELIARAQSGDRSAFGQLVRKHERRVFACAVQMMGQSSEVDDVVQDVFVRAFRAISKFDGRSELSTWLYRICVNVCLNRFRSGRRSKTVVDVELVMSALESGTQGPADTGGAAEVHADFLKRSKTPLELMELRRLYERLGVALDSLTPSLRSAVVLVLMQGLSHRAAAEVLDCSEGTVAWRIHEARRRLKGELSEEKEAPEKRSVRQSAARGGA